MTLQFTESFQKKASKLCKKDSQLQQELAKQFRIFEKNPRHPSLKLHKLVGKRSSQLAIWIKADLRALCIREGRNYIFFDLVTHDQY